MYDLLAPILEGLVFSALAYLGSRGRDGIPALYWLHVIYIGYTLGGAVAHQHEPEKFVAEMCALWPSYPFALIFTWMLNQKAWFHSFRKLKR